jgi:arsenate reductase
MAEAFLKKKGGSCFEVESAGLEAGKLNPVAVEVMREIGIDISENPTNSVFDFFREGRLYHYVITVCDENTAGQCPVFPGLSTRQHWNIEDPSLLRGSDEEVKIQARKIRDKIRQKVDDFINSIAAE